MEEKRPFGDYIRRKRQEAGLTQRELAARLFVTESSVSKWERGLSYPDVPIITSICKELGISEHEFFTACDDDKAHAQARSAAIWHAVKKSFRIICLVSYAIALVTCFICDLAIFHALDWFWIVLTSLALAFCFTNLPAYVQMERVAVCLGAATACLILLLLSCWWYVGGKWVLAGLVITAVSLALPWGWWAIWRFYGKHILTLCVAWTTVWVFPLLAVIRAFVEGGENWLLGLAFPLALVGGAFLWCYYLALRLPKAPLLKAGLCVLLSALATPTVNSLCDALLGEGYTAVPFLQYFSIPAMLARLRVGDPDWVNILLTIILTAAGIALTIVGGVSEYQKRKQKER